MFVYKRESAKLFVYILDTNTQKFKYKQFVSMLNINTFKEQIRDTKY